MKNILKNTLYYHLKHILNTIKPNKKWFQDEGENGMSLLIIKKEKNIRAFAFYFWVPFKFKNYFF
jgi:hypothetical protein